MKVLQFLGSWDQETDSLFTNHEPLIPTLSYFICFLVWLLTTYLLIYRYVGDILAWLHQAVAGEKELLYSLLKRTKMEGSKLLLSFKLLQISFN